jgi:N-methylhydantoinase A
VAVVEAAGLPTTGTDIVFEADMHYAGQTHTVAVPLALSVHDGRTGVTEAGIREAFEAAYRRAFGRTLPGVGVQLVNIRTAAIGRRPRFDLALLAPEAGGMPEPAHRPVWFDGGWHTAAIYDRLALPVGAVVQGPAVLEQPDATTVVDPGLQARVDEFGNLIVEPV